MTNILSLKRIAEIGGGFAPPTAAIAKAFLTLPSGSDTLASSLLLDVSILLLIREGLPMDQVASDPEDHQFSYDPFTGQIQFSVVNPTNDEQVYVLYYPNLASGPTMAIEPVTLTEARLQLRVDYPDDDVEIYQMIKRARKRIENYCNISIVAQRLQVVMEVCGRSELPYGPVTDVELVETPSQSSGSGPKTYTPTTTEWTVDGDYFGSEWYDGDVRHFSTRDRDFSGKTRITYTAGMDFVPDDLKQAILTELAYRFENRGDSQEAACPAALELAAPYRKIWL